MTTSIHNSPSIRNQLIGLIVVCGLDFHPSVDFQMHAIDAKNENLAICLACVSALKRTPLQSLANANALNRPKLQSLIVIHQPNNEPTQQLHFFALHLITKKEKERTKQNRKHFFEITQNSKQEKKTNKPNGWKLTNKFNGSWKIHGQVL